MDKGGAPRRATRSRIALRYRFTVLRFGAPEQRNLAGTRYSGKVTNQFPEFRLAGF